ncbi:hypothetical protein FE257_011211 [Aspergillus nanangensis]|uniref:t-SNARE coiled-coil homology domain-containing protein n=1 Tax=Aspergillus nanangensis TaxID=2582783 RepID=A0AAD4CJE5_ASPNN|nr:hypothetical protein FE257_011211 [Aspergillus nanangensis]
MSLKQEIETWVLALDHYDLQDFDEALRVFDAISDTSKICFNCGVIYATLGEHDKAVECYQRAVALDQYLAIAYFQEGVSNFLLGDFEEALANFNDTLLYLRGNTSIDYEQLGLKFRLYSCEVLFNRGLCYIYLRQMGPGIKDLEYAAKEKVTTDHDVIDDAIRERAESKDYLGKARLIAASDRHATPNAHEIQRTQSAMDNRPPDSLYATATHVHKNIIGRSRQQSEPPLHRNLFPPTPPPDADKASTSSSAGSIGGIAPPGSVRAARPPRLDLDRPGAHLSRSSDMSLEKPRIGTTRTASEPRGPPRQYPRNGGQEQARRERGHRRGLSDTAYPPSTQNGYEGDSYGTYVRPTLVTNGRRAPRQQERCIQEEDEFGSEECDDSPGAGGDFEMMGARRRTRSPHRTSRRGNSRRPEVRKFRVKVHAFEDTRYIMIGPTIDYGEFEARIRDKFGFRCMLKIRMQDEGDMITMVDQEDLDLLFSSARDTARREGSEMGKMEHQQPPLTDTDRDNIDTSTSLLLHDLNNSITTLSSAESLRHETARNLLSRKYAKSRLWQWAGGSSLTSSEEDADQSKPAEQVRDEQAERNVAAIRESVVWFLRQGEEVAAIEAELSPEQLQLFAEENDSMVRYYEDTLDKVQNAEKSLLEIASLQQTLVAHLATQEEYVGQLVADADSTQTNIKQGNQELKRATERRSTAQAVFWGTVGLCTWLVVWDLIF